MSGLTNPGAASAAAFARAKLRTSRLKSFRKNWDLYLILLVPVVYVIVFAYIPMYGAQIAFKDFNAAKGIGGSPWVGLKHFANFFKSYYFTRVLKNTVGISLYGLIAGFPFPIILAILLNEVGNHAFKKTVQMVTYIPYFISTVVFVGIVIQMLDPRLGVVNRIIMLFGGKGIPFMAKPELLQSIYVWSGIWQGTGYGSVIYLAALSAIDPTLYEAAIVDGASRMRRIWHIDLPSILPTMVILFILSMGGIMSVGVEKILLMQTPLNLRNSEVIATYVYKVGILSADYSYSTAIGFFNSMVNFLLLVVFNEIAKRMSETSLW